MPVADPAQGVETFIDFGDGADDGGQTVPVDTWEPTPKNPEPAPDGFKRVPYGFGSRLVETNKSIKKRTGLRPRAPEHKRYTEWCRTYLDLADRGRTADGQVPRVSNARLEEELAGRDARTWQGRVPKLNGTQLLRHRAEGEKFHAVSRYQPPGEQPTMALRIDADAHGEHQRVDDALAVLNDISSRFLGGRLFIEQTSAQGAAAWLVVELPDRTRWDGTTRSMSKFEANAAADELIQAIRLLYAHVDVALEVQGTFTLTQRDQEGRRRVVRRGQQGRLPICRKDEDVEKLWASRFTGNEVYAIVTAARHVAAEQHVAAVLHGNAPQATPAPAPTPAQAGQQPTKPGKPRRSSKNRGARREVQRIHDRGKTHLNRTQCMRHAAQQLCRGRAPDEGDLEPIIELANKLYHEHSLNGGARDADRDRAFAKIGRWLIETHDPELTANTQQIWWDEADRRAAAHICRQRVSKAHLSRLNAKHKHDLKGCKLTHENLTIAVLYACKNSVADKEGNPTKGQECHGHFPHHSIRDALTFEGYRANSKLVQLLLEFAEKAGFIKMTLAHDRKRPLKCRSCCYALGRAARALPFVAEHYEAEQQSEQSESPQTGPGGAITVNHTLSSDGNSIGATTTPSFPQFTPPSHTTPPHNHQNLQSSRVGAAEPRF